MSRAQLSRVAHLVLGEPDLKFLVPSPVPRRSEYICQLHNNGQMQAHGNLTAQLQPVAA